MHHGYELHIELRSDGTFGKGSGLPGRVDIEVEYDLETGLPFIRGRVLKGLLVDSCATTLRSVRQQNQPTALSRLRSAAAWLFGRPGSRVEDEGKLHVERGQPPKQLRNAVARDVEAGRYSAEAAREALTTVRHQTAVDDVEGAPKKGSLRTRRVLLRETVLTAPLTINESPSDDALALLYACARLVRRGGLRRSRGNARLKSHLSRGQEPQGEPKTSPPSRHFDALVRGEDSASPADA